MKIKANKPACIPIYPAGILMWQGFLPRIVISGLSRPDWTGQRCCFLCRILAWGLRAPPLFAKGRLVRPLAFLTRPSRRVFYWPQQMKKIDWTKVAVAAIRAIAAIIVAWINHPHSS